LIFAISKCKKEFEQQGRSYLQHIIFWYQQPAGCITYEEITTSLDQHSLQPHKAVHHGSAHTP
jgi:hypothetical protein